MFRRNPEESNLVRYIKNDDIDSFQLLVDSTINVNFKFSIFLPCLDEFLRFSPSLLAVSAYYKAVQIFRYLLVSGADLTVKDKRNMSIAHFAVYGGDFEILHLLDEYGAPFDGTLFTAAERGYEDVFKWILYYQSEDLHQRKKDGTSLVDASSKGGNWKLTTFILDSIKDDLSITEAYRLLQLLRESNYNQSDESDESDESEEYYEYDDDNENITENNNEENEDNKSNSNTSESDSEKYDQTESDSENENQDSEFQSESDDNEESKDDNDSEICDNNESKNTENEINDSNGSKNTENKISDSDRSKNKENEISDNDEEENKNNDNTKDSDEKQDTDTEDESTSIVSDYHI